MTPRLSAVVVTEVTGRSLTARLDRALHVAPLANSGADYYLFLLIAVKAVTALASSRPRCSCGRFVLERPPARAGAFLRKVGHRHDGMRTATGLRRLAADRLVAFVCTSVVSSRPG